MRRDSYYPHVALLQICAGDKAWLIDPLAIKDLDQLRALLTAPHVRKILHSCSEDLEVFRRWLGVLPAPLIDTQKAAALLGEDHGLGYRSLVQRLLGVELEKGETRSDWLQRPLTESQCNYAAQDVVQLLRAWALLKQRAEEQQRLTWIQEEGEEAARALAERDRDQYRRIKSASKLSSRQLAALKFISEWREDRAQTVDKPRGWLLDDKACLSIAQAMPEDTAALASLEAVPASVVRKQGDTLLECVAKARQLAADVLPEALPRPLPPELRNELKSLRKLAREIASDLQIAPEILISGADLELLLRDREGESIKEPTRWSGWRKDVVIEPLKTVLRTT